VDDDYDLAQLFVDAIKSSGLNTIGFDRPLDAVDYLRRHHSEVCLVVTDWKMPEMNGLELTRKVAEIDDEIEVMLMSAYELQQDQLKEVNKNDYLKKPVHIKTLIDTIKKEYFAKDCKDTCDK
jgi:two-component SAPR family response regulator